MNKFNKILSYLSGILAIIVSVIFIQQKAFNRSIR